MGVFQMIRTRWYAWILLALVFVILPASALAGGGDTYRVSPGEHMAGDVATISQPIVVDGDVEGDVTSWSGDIMVNGHVSGDVVSYTGHVYIAASASIGGSVMSIGGGIDRAAQAQVAHATIGNANENAALSSMMGVIVPSGGTPASSSALAGRIILGLMAGLFVLAFVLAGSAIWPNRTFATALMLQAVPQRAIVVGGLSTVAVAAISLPLIGLLAASIVGLPLLLVLLVGVNAPYVYGLAAMARSLSLALGDPLRPAPVPHRSAIAALAGVAVLVAVVCALNPLGGLLLFYAIASPGLGAVILSRAGLIVPAPVRLGE